MKYKALFLIILLFFVETVVFAFVNVGVGYNFSKQNNWTFRIGYESDTFVANADYGINSFWNINSAFFFNTPMSLGIGPMLNVFNNFSDSKMKITFGPSIILKYNNQNELRLGFLYDFSNNFQITNPSENLYIQFRYYAPDPPGMKMKDRLYVELGYFSPNLFFLVGLLEPF